MKLLPTVILLTASLGACSQANRPDPDPAVTMPHDDPTPSPAPTPGPEALAREEVATFGAGCYWCVEAVLEQLDGVQEVTAGFMGGTVPNPEYEQVCAGTTGHAEVVHVRFDPTRISYETLLEWFWKLHDPTTLNRQGADEGTQYRSVVFFHSPEQEAAARASARRAQERFLAPIVTEISPAGPFFLAGADHQDFYRNNPRYGYCRIVIQPKLQKLGLEK